MKPADCTCRWGRLLFLAVLGTCLLSSGCASTVVRSERRAPPWAGRQPARQAAADQPIRTVTAVETTTPESPLKYRVAKPMGPPVLAAHSVKMSAAGPQDAVCVADCEEPVPCCPGIWWPPLPYLSCTRWLGPLVAGHSPAAPDAAIQPPWSRFHPVPTQPVFAPRSESTLIESLDSDDRWSQRTGPEPLTLPNALRPITPEIETER